MNCIIKTTDKQIIVWRGKYARIFVCGNLPFRDANSFRRAKVKENFWLRGTDNVQGQINEHIFAANGGYCVYYPSNFIVTCGKKCFRSAYHLLHVMQFIFFSALMRILSW